MGRFSPPLIARLRVVHQEGWICCRLLRLAILQKQQQDNTRRIGRHAWEIPTGDETFFSSRCCAELNVNTAPERHRAVVMITCGTIHRLSSIVSVWTMVRIPINCDPWMGPKRCVVESACEYCELYCTYVHTYVCTYVRRRVCVKNTHPWASNECACASNLSGLWFMDIPCWVFPINNGS